MSLITLKTIHFAGLHVVHDAINVEKPCLRGFSCLLTLKGQVFAGFHVVRGQVERQTKEVSCVV